MLTTGTTIIEIAIAHTPISGDFDAAVLKPEVREITRVAIYHKNKWMSKMLKSIIEYIKSHEFSS